MGHIKVKYLLNHLQPQTKYLRKTSCEVKHYGESSISIFKESFASTDKIFCLGGRMGTRL